MKLFRFIPRIYKSLRRDSAIFIYCLKHELPFARTRRDMKSLRINENVSAYTLMGLDYMITNREVNDTFMFHREYIERALEINTLDNLWALRDKAEFYRRCPQFLGRECLDVTTASPAEVEDFLKRHKRFVGKMNFGLRAKSFCVYDAPGMTPEQLRKNMERLNQTLLEGYIVQHKTLMDIHPSSVNTVRIHTMNNGSEVKMFLKPMLRTGCDGSRVDTNAENDSYRTLIEDDGSLSHITYIDRLGRCKKAVMHRTSKVRFSDVRIPYMPEAVQLVRSAAVYFPELPYISWDVAITPQGPVIVEGNSISGATGLYQQMVYLHEKHGIRRQLLDMFDYGRP